VVAIAIVASGPSLAAAHGGGGGGHFGGFGGHAGGFAGHAGGGFSAHSYGGGHFAGYGGGFAGRGYGAHFAGAAAYHGAGYGYGYGYHGGFRPWGGGYWGGYYWPRAYFGLGFAWFLPALPLYYSTYWYDGVPYYYADDAYYTWSPSDGGYVATNPPPLAAAPPVEGAPAGAAPEAGPPPGSGAGPEPAGPRIFAYPKNNQSDEQQATDRRECEQWAAGQTSGASSPDYRRAMIVCFEGRGYSAQ